MSFKENIFIYLYINELQDVLKPFTNYFWQLNQVNQETQLVNMPTLKPVNFDT